MLTLDKIEITVSQKFPELYEINMEELRKNSDVFGVKNNYETQWGQKILVGITYTFDNFTFSTDGGFEKNNHGYLIHHFADDIIYLELVSWPITHSN